MQKQLTYWRVIKERWGVLLLLLLHCNIISRHFSPKEYLAVLQPFLCYKWSLMFKRKLQSHESRQYQQMDAYGASSPLDSAQQGASNGHLLNDGCTGTTENTRRGPNNTLGNGIHANWRRAAKPVNLCSELLNPGVRLGNDISSFFPPSLHLSIPLCWYWKVTEEYYGARCCPVCVHARI